MYHHSSAENNDHYQYEDQPLHHFAKNPPPYQLQQDNISNQIKQHTKNPSSDRFNNNISNNNSNKYQNREYEQTQQINYQKNNENLRGIKHYQDEDQRQNKHDRRINDGDYQKYQVQEECEQSYRVNSGRNYLMEKLGEILEQVSQIKFMKESLMTKVKQQSIKCNQYVRQINKFLFQNNIASQKEIKLNNNKNSIENFKRNYNGENNREDEICDKLLIENKQLKNKYENMLIFYKAEIQQMEMAIQQQQQLIPRHLDRNDSQNNSLNFNKSEDFTLNNNNIEKLDENQRLYIQELEEEIQQLRGIHQIMDGTIKSFEKELKFEKEKHLEKIKALETHIGLLEEEFLKEQERFNGNQQQNKDIEQHFQQLSYQLKLCEDNLKNSQEKYVQMQRKYKEASRQNTYLESQFEQKKLQLYEKEKIINEKELLINKEMKDINRREEKISEVQYNLVKRQREEKEYQQGRLKSQYFGNQYVADYHEKQNNRENQNRRGLQMNPNNESRMSDYRQKSQGKSMSICRIDISGRLKQIADEKKRQSYGFNQNKHSRASNASDRYQQTSYNPSNRSNSKDHYNISTIKNNLQPNALKRDSTPKQFISTNQKLENIIKSLHKELNQIK